MLSQHKINAMLTEISSFLNRSSDRDLLGRSVVITDSGGADGGFLVHHFIAQALRDGHITILVSCAQSYTHYNSVGTKLGVSFSRHEEQGHLVFIDCLTKLTTQQQNGPTDEEVKGQTRHTFSLDSAFSLRGLYKLLHQCLLDVRRVKPDKPVCLVLDDLSVLVSVGVRLVEVVGLVHYCQHMVTSTAHTALGGGYMVTMVHCEGGGGCDEETLGHHLAHKAHLSLHVEGLPSGYSRDVHGQVRAVWRDSLPVLRREAQFKLTDRTAHLFAKGTSSAVL
ncbi:elongator complex protein 6-like [Halichondria panicea]|uniref:elongator complex protein 6-like n=1 Tax=Halichondria panicea TaxID=6063 RepID=UPI00312B57DE